MIYFNKSNSLSKLSIFCMIVAVTVCISCYANYDKSRIAFYNFKIPKDMELRERILTTLSCEDCDDIPKCKNAGSIVHEGEDAYQLMHNGIQIVADCYYGKWMTLLIELSKGHHEPQEEKVFYDVLQSLPSNAIMVELGAYWGYYSLWFQKEISNATTYLVEPDYKNLLIGKKNFSINQYNGEFTHAMVGSYSAKEHPFTNWDYETFLIPQISIDDFVKTKQIPYIHILHSDIQGAEVDMLEGCKKLIKEKLIGYLFISTHRGTHEKCLEKLKNTEYEILLSITREESFSADGLIIAKSPEIQGSFEFDITRRTSEMKKYLHEVASEKNIN